MFQSGHFLTVEVKAKPGQDPDKVHNALLMLCDASSREPGCLIFTVHRSLQDPSAFVLWEGFRDEASLAAHASEAHSQHFSSLALIDLVRIFKSARA